MSETGQMSGVPLAGRVAIVTGASSGIGTATATAFAAAGAMVVASGRNREAVDRTVSAVADSGGRAEAVIGDVTDAGFCDALVGETVERHGRLDVLANVAGAIVRGDATETTDEQWHHLVRTNVDSVFFLSRAAVRAMRPRRRGVILNLGSTVGLVGAAELPAYGATKGAVVLLTKAMAIDHAAEGIRVNAVCPGAVDTPMLVSEHERRGYDRNQAIAANLPSIPQNRVPEPSEVADVLVFLASDAAAHITGVALPVDGGYTAQ